MKHDVFRNVAGFWLSYLRNVVMMLEPGSVAGPVGFEPPAVKRSSDEKKLPRLFVSKVLTLFVQPRVTYRKRPLKKWSSKKSRSRSGRIMVAIQISL